MARRVKVRGDARMRQLGYKCVKVWFDPKELPTVQAAAENRHRKLASFVHDAAMKVARQESD